MQPGPNGQPVPEVLAETPVAHIWHEELQVASVDIGPDKNTPQRVLIKVKVMSPADSGSPNANRSHTEFLRLDPRQPDGGYNMMTEISLRKIDSFIQAAEAAYVEENGMANPLATLEQNVPNARFKAAVRFKQRFDKKNQIWRKEMEVLGQAN